jgi:hypothetical protein
VILTPSPAFSPGPEHFDMIRFDRSVIAMIRISLALALCALCGSATHAGFVTFEAAGANPAAIAPTVDSFRAAISGPRTEINWDGVPDSLADPNSFPADFFNTTSARGVEFSTPGTGFLVSANAGGTTPILFGFPNDFQTFSAQRLFTAINSNIIDVLFFVPGTTTAATTSAFGVVFTDVEVTGASTLEFFDASDSLIYSRTALVSGNQGLSFLGALAGAGELISRVRITVGENTIVSNGVLGNFTDDVSALDDFIYATPSATVSPIPEPSSVILAMLGLIGCAGWERIRRRK